MRCQWCGISGFIDTSLKGLRNFNGACVEHGLIENLNRFFVWDAVFELEVFVDMACIHQGDPDLKSEGALNIGAFLKNSKKLLVLWDSTYSSRAWCMFELAAFLQSHQSEVNLPIDIKPVAIAPATFAFVVGNTFMLLCEIILPAGGFFRFLRFVYLVPAFVMIHVFHKHWCEAWSTDVFDA